MQGQEKVEDEALDLKSQTEALVGRQNWASSEETALQVKATDKVTVEITSPYRQLVMATGTVK